MPPKAISTKPYADIARAGKPVAQRRRILGLLNGSGRALNRRQISKLTSIPINVVCWRVKGMLDSDLLQVVGEAKDEVTGHDAELLFPTSGKVRQLDLHLEIGI